MSDEPVTPAGLPRNREADAWRTDAAMWQRVALASWYVAAGLTLALYLTAKDRDAARAQVSAAEQRAERAEARARDVDLTSSACRDTRDVFWRYYIECRTARDACHGGQP